MTTGEDRTALGPQGPALSVDTEIDEFLWTEPPDPAGFADHIRGMIEADEERAVFGLARTISRLSDSIQTLSRQQAAIDAEYRETMGRASERLRWAEQAIEQIVRGRRDDGRGGRLHLPTVGTWSSRKVAARWALPSRAADRDALQTWLDDHPDDRAEVTQTVVVVDNDRLRGWLDRLVRDHPDDWEELLPPGVEHVESYVSVTYQMEARR